MDVTDKFEQLRAYLAGALTDIEAKKFEEVLQTDKELRDELELMQLAGTAHIHAARQQMKNNPLLADIERVFKENERNTSTAIAPAKPATPIGWWLLLAALMLGLAYLFLFPKTDTAIVPQNIPPQKAEQPIASEENQSAQPEASSPQPQKQTPASSPKRDYLALAQRHWNDRLATDFPTGNIKGAQTEQSLTDFTDTLVLARIYFDKKQDEAVVALLQPIFKKTSNRSDYPQDYALLGAALFQTNKTKQAAMVFRDLKNLYSTQQPNATARDRMEWYELLALLAGDEKDWEEFTRLFQKAQKHNTTFAAELKALKAEIKM